MKKEEVIKSSRDAIESIKRDLIPGVIKECSIPPLASAKSGKLTGYAVVLQVSTKYHYAEKVLKGWKKKLGADGWNIHVYRGQLFIRFFIHNK